MQGHFSRSVHLDPCTRGVKHLCPYICPFIKSSKTQGLNGLLLFLIASSTLVTLGERVTCFGMIYSRHRVNHLVHHYLSANRFRPRLSRDHPRAFHRDAPPLTEGLALGPPDQLKNACTHPLFSRSPGGCLPGSSPQSSS